MIEATELRIPDVLTFLAVCAHGSVTGAARDLKVTPSQVSKAVARLEKHLKRPLLSRKARGVSASEEGRKIVPLLEDLVAKVHALSATGDVPPELRLTVAAPSYLCAAFLPAIVEAVPDARFRGLEAGSSFMRAYASDNLFHIALTIGEEKMPDAWVIRARANEPGVYDLDWVEAEYSSHKERTFIKLAQLAVNLNKVFEVEGNTFNCAV